MDCDYGYADFGYDYEAYEPCEEQPSYLGDYENHDLGLECDDCAEPGEGSDFGHQQQEVKQFDAAVDEAYQEHQKGLEELKVQEAENQNLKSELEDLNAQLAALERGADLPAQSYEETAEAAAADFEENDEEDIKALQAELDELNGKLNGLQDGCDYGNDAVFNEIQQPEEEYGRIESQGQAFENQEQSFTNHPDDDLKGGLQEVNDDDDDDHGGDRVSEDENALREELERLNIQLAAMDKNEPQGLDQGDIWDNSVSDPLHTMDQSNTYDDQNIADDLEHKVQDDEQEYGNKKTSCNFAENEETLSNQGRLSQSEALENHGDNDQNSHTVEENDAHESGSEGAKRLSHEVGSNAETLDSLAGDALGDDINHQPKKNLNSSKMFSFGWLKRRPLRKQGKPHSQDHSFFIRIFCA